MHHLIQDLTQDVRFALRTLGRTPGFALIAVACVALGIGVNTASFSILNALAFRSLPGVERQDRLMDVRVGHSDRFGRVGPSYVWYPEYEMYCDGSPGFAAVAASAPLPAVVRDDGDPFTVAAEAVSGNYFAVLGTRPALGRFFAAGASQSDDDASVVVGYDFWRRHLGANRGAIGRSLTVNGRVLTVIGVAPPQFVGVQPGEPFDSERGSVQLWLPLAAAPPDLTGAPVLRLTGRLADGVTREQAEAGLNAAARRIAAAFPAERRDAYAVAYPLGVGPGGMTAVLAAVALFMSVPAIVLLVACANLANLLLARGAARRREVAVRLSLGATRARLVRQLLTESVLLALFGAAPAVLVAVWAADIARAFSLALPFDAPLDWRVLAFACLTALATAVLFGLAPALRATRPDVAAALKAGDGAAAGGGRSKLRGALVVAQVALSLVLLATSGLLIRTARTLHGGDIGMERRRLLLVWLDLGLAGDVAFAPREVAERVLERLRALPGVEAAGLATWTPFGSPPEERQVTVLGGPAGGAEWAKVGEVGGDYFAAAGIPLRQGRLLGPADRPGAPPAAVVNERLARYLFPDGRAVGRRVRLARRLDDTAAVAVEVVGVVADTRSPLQDQPRLTMFLAAQQYPRPAFMLYLRTSDAPERMAAPVRSELRALDPRLPVLDVATVGGLLAREVSPLRAAASGMGLLGALALILAAAGLYAVMSYLVAQRAREIGIRVALGALRSHVVALVLREAIALTAVGVVVGLAAAAGVGALIASVLYGARPADPLTFGATAALLLVVAIAASLVPVRRATGIDPMAVLRHE